ncbi:MAG: hypothetical protein AAF597_11445 [Bacteroidota bacterium]
MKIFLDENISYRLARGLNELFAPENYDRDEPIEIVSVVDEFGRGITDEEWIPQVGKVGGCFLSLDQNIRRRQSQWQLCQEHKVGAIFLKMGGKRKGLPYWQQVEFVVKKWAKIMQQIDRLDRPFGLEVTDRKIRILPN